MLERYYGNRSYRKFVQREIEQEKIDFILEALRVSHCGNNRQVLRYIVIQSKECRDAIAPHVHYAASLPKEIGTPKKDEEAMAYIVILRPEAQNPIADVDTGIAAERITDAAWQQGIGSCMIMNFDQAEVKNLLQMPEGYIPRIIVSLGYPKINSLIEPVEDGILKYWVDEDGNYHVPKMSIDDLVIKQ